MLDRFGEKGLLETTSILVTSEFGRTRTVNKNAGRDHWARAMCALMAGGSVSGGRVVGATDEKAEGPLADGYSPDDLAATFLRNISINPKRNTKPTSAQVVFMRARSADRNDRAAP